MNEQTFKDRTRKLALDVVRLVGMLPRGRSVDVLARQLLRAGTSVGANYRAACRGKSASDVLAKLAIVEEEADEVVYWLDLIIDAGMTNADRVQPLRKEADEIVAMTVASIKTMRAKTRKVKEAVNNPKSQI